MTQPPKDKQPETPPQRRNWAGAVAGDASFAARSVFARAGFEDPTLVVRWAEIAGAETARIARPIKFSEGLSGGTLTLKTEPAAALFLQHDTRALCDRINTYLGRPAVTKLKFVQGTLAPLPPPPPRLRPASEPPPADPARRWRGPPSLGEALLSLARHRRRRPSTD